MAQGPCGDMEDLPNEPLYEAAGLLIDRRSRWRRRGLYVTDFCASEWCQQQAAFELTAKVPKRETEAMHVGTHLHAALEMQVSETVEVQISTREDAWAVRLLNTLRGLHQLLETGLARELYVFGRIQGCLVRGIIDQVALDDTGAITILEHKTRRSCSLPQEAQRRTARLQLLMYRFLFKRFGGMLLGARFHEAMHQLGLNPLQKLSKPVCELARQAGAGSSGGTLEVVAQLASSHMKLLSARPISLQVRYIYQHTKEVIADVAVPSDDRFLLGQVACHLAVWDGLRPPQRVCVQEAYKCHHCQFNEHCWRRRPEPAAEAGNGAE